MTTNCKEKPDENILTESEIKDMEWTIRPSCHLYKEEYSECKSIKGRFQQYFVYGDYLDCSQWKKDYDNCRLYEDKKDLKAGSELVKSEEIRRQKRLGAHYGNNTWKKRAEPPEAWNSKLPEHIEERNKNTYLEVKAKEMRGESVEDPYAKSSFCKLM